MKKIGMILIILLWFVSNCFADSQPDILQMNADEQYKLLSKYSYNDKLYELLDEIEMHLNVKFKAALEKLVQDYEGRASVENVSRYGKTYVLVKKIECLEKGKDDLTCLRELLYVPTKNYYMELAIENEVLSRFAKVGNEETANLIKSKFKHALGYEIYLKIKIRNMDKQKVIKLLVSELKDPELKLHERIATVKVARETLDKSDVKEFKQELSKFKKEDKDKDNLKNKEVKEFFVRAIQDIGGDEELKDLDPEDLEFLKIEELERKQKMEEIKKREQKR